MAIHNIEITLKNGGQFARAACVITKLNAQEGKSATLKYIYIYINIIQEAYVKKTTASLMKLIVRKRNIISKRNYLSTLLMIIERNHMFYGYINISIHERING